MKKLLLNQKGFTLVEMLIVMLVITMLLLIMLPNATKNTSVIGSKGCDAFINIIVDKDKYIYFHYFPVFEHKKRSHVLQHKASTDFIPITEYENSLITIIIQKYENINSLFEHALLLREFQTWNDLTHAKLEQVRFSHCQKVGIVSAYIVSLFTSG